MIADSSALVAVVIEEPEFEAVWDRLGAAENVGVWAPTLFEAAMVLRARLGPSARTLLGAVSEQIAIEVLAFDDRHWPVALDAFTRFGKGRHPAGLNFGDCLAYATASVAGEPLLCLGDGFAQTDLELA